MAFFDKVIQGIEMVADDLYDMAETETKPGGYRSMAAVLRGTVPEIQALVEDYLKKEKEIEIYGWHYNMSEVPLYTDVLFYAKTRLSYYYFVGQKESSGTYVRAIDKEVVLDEIMAWKEI